MALPIKSSVKMSSAENLPLDIFALIGKAENIEQAAVAM